LCFKNIKIQYNTNAATVGAVNVNSFLSLSVGGSIRKNRKKKKIIQKSSRRPQDNSRRKLAKI